MPKQIDLYVVYRNPDDYPDEFIVRKQTALPSGRLRSDEELFARGADLETVRKALPKGLYRIDRQIQDPMCIEEVWL